MVIYVGCGIGVLLTLDQLRLFGDPLLANLIVLETHFYYALIGLLLPLAFVYYRYADSPRYNLVAVDILLAMLSVYCSFWLFLSSVQILDEGWEFVAPDQAVMISFLLWLLTMEAVRRVGGSVLFLLVLLFSFFPLVADRMPEMLSGIAIGLRETASYHAMSSESLLGLPFRAFANLVIGFLYSGGFSTPAAGSFSLISHLRYSAESAVVPRKFRSSLAG